MNTYISSDLHVFHKKILDFCPKSRPFQDVDDMNQAIVDNCNKVIKENDTFYILGDVSFGRVSLTVELLNSIKCKNKILIVGNHDENYLRKLAFRECFKEIHHYYELKHNGNKIILSHYPFLEWNGSRRGINSSYMFHGHCHSKNPEKLSCKRWDCGLDGSETFSPYNLDSLITHIDSIFDYDQKPD